MDRIMFFDGDYNFLSNMYPCHIKFEGRWYTNSEACYQAMKCANIKDKDRFVDLDGKEAKKLGKKIKIRKDWDEVKDKMMYHVVSAKFYQNPILKAKLRATGTAYLEEGNTWGDTYWGTVLGRGENKLGKILMYIREHECY